MNFIQKNGFNLNFDENLGTLGKFQFVRPPPMFAQKTVFDILLNAKCVGKCGAITPPIVERP